MNQLIISARLLEPGALRKTPAGVDIIEAVCEHCNTVHEAGMPRQLNFTFEAKALGEAAVQLSRLQPGTEFQISGFVSPRRKNSNRLIIHIQQINSGN